MHWAHLLRLWNVHTNITVKILILMGFQVAWRKLACIILNLNCEDLYSILLHGAGLQVFDRALIKKHVVIYSMLFSS